MHSYWSGMCDRERARAREEREATNQNGKARAHAGGRLRAVAAVLLTLTAGMPPGFAQQAGAGSKGPDKAASELARGAYAGAHAAVSSAHFEPRLFQTLRRLAGQSHQHLPAHDDRQGKLYEFRAARRPGEGRQDLPEPLRRDCFGD